MNNSEKSIEERMWDLESRYHLLETALHNMNDDLDWLEDFFRRYIEIFPSTSELTKPLMANDLNTFFKDYKSAWIERNCY